MKHAAGFLLLLTLSGAAISAEHCAVKEDAVLGAWSSIGGAGFFQEFELQKADGSNTFNSWLHERPELMNAEWTLDNCQLVITPSHAESSPFRFNVLELKGDRLRLRDESDSSEARYKRVRVDK